MCVPCLSGNRHGSSMPCVGNNDTRRQLLLAQLVNKGRGNQLKRGNLARQSAWPQALVLARFKVYATSQKCPPLLMSSQQLDITFT